ncbi:MAG: hypothetical protein Q4C61_05950 [Lachnospiraceae bacterium]|nr:hypothetical protein [Lachnospiraceae bacterium]
MKKVKKGNWGYIKYQKKRTFLITFVMFLIPLTIYVTGYIQTKTRLNLFTFVAILGCLPACKSLVSLIMIMMQKPLSAENYEAARKANGDLVAGYELVFTAYEHTTPVNTLVVCGDQVVCYTPDEKTDEAYLEKHISKILTVNGYPSAQVRVMKDFRKYQQRAADICSRQEHYREGIEFTPDERYPDLSREELIYHTLLAISL